MTAPAAARPKVDTSVSSALGFANEDEGAEAMDCRDPQAHEEGLLVRAREPKTN